MEPSDAQPPPVAVAIVWQAPSECPEGEIVRTSTEKLLGRPLDAPGLRRVLARAQVRKNSMGHWEVSFLLAAEGGVSEETLAADECGALADAVALKVALAADPFAVLGPTAPPVAPTTPDARAPSRPPPDANRTPSPRFGARFVGGPVAEVLPEVRPGLLLAGFLEWSPFRVELGGALAWGAEARYPTLDEVGASFQLFAGVLRGCAIPMVKTLRFPLCLGLEVGSMRGSGFGVAVRESSERVWSAVVFGPAAIVPLSGNLSLWLETDMTVSLLRPSFRMQNLDTLYRVPSLGAQGWIGVEIALGP